MQNTPRTVTNTITGQVAGHIIQAGTITGGLNLNTTPASNPNPDTSRTPDTHRQAYEDTTEPR
ncbi:hypothetical protein SAMN06297387_12843 [Streptomyces zhaozhouensis]|uniref:Uncharacterized protein n=1 Tax=Streptomyces zhaozhouensis TaxID=1300267 RepID=A0A286E833_9ACTN|nr:hypothetical protein [Streptomyces zhaozhouensis]SOD67043.1 hypothetical protein SAMN06297387_12843 [Streptomyces zhaozhouensis]